MTGRSYKKSVGQLVQSRWGRNKTDDLSSVFCSELVAAAFKQLELLPESLVSCNVLPKDLAGNSKTLWRFPALCLTDPPRPSRRLPALARRPGPARRVSWKRRRSFPVVSHSSSSRYAPKLHALLAGRRPYLDVMEALERDAHSDEDF
jgi:hypothetical protein